MENNNSKQWVDECLARLDPQSEWLTSTDRAFTRFDVRRAARKNFIARALAPEVSLRAWLWGAAIAAVACACLLAFPTSRDFVQRLWVGRSSARMVYVGQVYADLKTLKDKQPAADFTLKDVQGRDIRLSDYRGKVVLINFWATWCPPCRQEIPELTELQAKYKNKLQIIGISMDDAETPAQINYVRDVASQLGVNYPVAIATPEIVEAYGGVSSLPSTFLVDREGTICAASCGVINREGCEKEILRLGAN